LKLFRVSRQDRLKLFGRHKKIRLTNSPRSMGYNTSCISSLCAILRWHSSGSFTGFFCFDVAGVWTVLVSLFLAGQNLRDATGLPGVGQELIKGYKKAICHTVMGVRGLCETSFDETMT